MLPDIADPSPSCTKREIAALVNVKGHAREGLMGKNSRDSSPAPKVITQEIVDDVEAALEKFWLIEEI